MLPQALFNLIVILIIIGFAQQVSTSLILTPVTAENSSTYVTYSSREDGIAISLPSDWKRIDDKKLSFVTPGQGILDFFREGLSIIVGPTYNKTLEMLANFAIDNHKKTLRDFKLMESDSNIVISKHPAHKIVYEFSDIIWGKIIIVEIGIIRSDNIYTVQFVSQSYKYGEYIPIIRNVTNSIRFIQ
jgi:hypothetical protein